MRRPRIITLTTDIGWAYAAQMKAVLARTAPDARIVDVAHDVRPQSIGEAAFVLGHLAPQFPPGTIHIAVVDPGVGGARAPVAVATADGSFLVGPDNGVLALACRALGGGRAVRIVPARLGRLGQVSATFEGRDVFAPAAAALATGRPIARLGPPHPLRGLSLPSARKTARSVVGQIVYVDVFGNLVTNLPADSVPPGLVTLSVRVGGGAVRRAGVWRTYEDGRARALGVLPSSFGWVELAVRNGSAAHRLGGRPGLAVTLRWSPSPGEAVN
jgi:S-adenosylmethionine hydrolase